MPSQEEWWWIDVRSFSFHRHVLIRLVYCCRSLGGVSGSRTICWACFNRSSSCRVLGGIWRGTIFCFLELGGSLDHGIIVCPSAGTTFERFRTERTKDSFGVVVDVLKEWWWTIINITKRIQRHIPKDTKFTKLHFDIFFVDGAPRLLLVVLVLLLGLVWILVICIPFFDTATARWFRWNKGTELLLLLLLTSAMTALFTTRCCSKFAMEIVLQIYIIYSLYCLRYSCFVVLVLSTSLHRNISIYFVCCHSTSEIESRRNNHQQ